MSTLFLVRRVRFHFLLNYPPFSFSGWIPFFPFHGYEVNYTVSLLYRYANRPPKKTKSDSDLIPCVFWFASKFFLAPPLLMPREAESKVVSLIHQNKPRTRDLLWVGPVSPGLIMSSKVLLFTYLLTLFAYLSTGLTVNQKVGELKLTVELL